MKKFDDIFSRLDTIHQRDGRTDRNGKTIPRSAFYPLLADAR